MARLRALGARLAAAPAKLKPAPKTTDPFYLSSEWRALIQRRKLDRDYFAALGRRRYPGERLILDHVIERRDGGAELDPANTEWLTMSEHQAKTARARAERAQGHR